MKKIITVSREFGSGGRSIGKMVAEKLGYEYYDSELVQRVAEETGFSAEYIADAGEYAQANVEYLQAALEAAKKMEV